jgi:hypothetical protein
MYRGKHTRVNNFKGVPAHSLINTFFCRDLSFNIGLHGTMPASIGSLSQLTTLYVSPALDRNCSYQTYTMVKQEE